MSALWTLLGVSGLTLAVIVAGLVTSKRATLAIIKNIRPIRVVHYQAMALFGTELYLLGLGSFVLTAEEVSRVALILIAGTFAWIAQVFLNDIADLEGDKLSNNKRPLVQGDISIKTAWILTIALAVISLLISGFLGSKIFLAITGSHVLGLIYSIGPFRTKKYYLLGTFNLALVATMPLLAGFLYYRPLQLLPRSPLLCSG